MALNERLLVAGRCAAQVLSDTDINQRMSDGYTRVDPVQIAEAADVALMFCRMEKLLGAYLKDSRPGILLNLDRPAGLVHMTCAHELGHHFLGHDATADEAIEGGKSAAPVEQEADTFAYNLLASRQVLVNVMKKKRWGASQLQNPATIYQLSLRLGTSYTSAVWSLARNNVISWTDAARLANNKKAPKAHKQELLGTHASVMDSWKSDVWLLDEYDRDLILEPHAGDKFVIDLPSHAAAGYLWSTDTAASEGFVIEPVHFDTVDVANQNKTQAQSRFGEIIPQRCIVSSTSIEPADLAPAAIALVQSQPWIGPVEQDDRYKAATQFEFLRIGASAAEKSMLVNQVKGT
jgi:Zn-dependent peptidase ImmA (M78 family)